MDQLRSDLSESLPVSDFRLIFLQARPVQSNNLLVYRKRDSDHKPKLTIKVRHFVGLIDDNDLFLLGFEAIIYLVVYQEKAERVIFVSKADTTGLSRHKVKTSEVIAKVLKYLINYDIKNYCINVKLKTSVHQSTCKDRVVDLLYDTLERLRVDGVNYYRSIPYYQDTFKLPSILNGTNILLPSQFKTFIAMFNRPSEQYLFPNSSKNSNKHISDGNHLLRWWIRILNDCLKSSQYSWTCKINIPGSDNHSMSKFLPVSNDNLQWRLGSIFHEDQNDLAIYQIPFFPDDPKSRFLEHIVVENRYKTLTLKQFWEELAFRQEFRLGKTVGIIGCESSLGIVESELHPSSHCVLSVQQYKKAIGIINGHDFHDADDVKQLTNSSLPKHLSECGVENGCVLIHGKGATTSSSTTSNSLSNHNTVNDLSFSVRSISKKKLTSKDPSRDKTLNAVNNLVPRKKYKPHS